jgi:hypothetical protein
MPPHNNKITFGDGNGQIAAEVYRAPYTGCDPDQAGLWPQLDWATCAALETCIRGTPWADQFLLAAMILAAHRWPAWRIMATLCALHGHLLTVFQAGAFSQIGEWDVQSERDDDLWSNRWTGRERERRVAFWEQYQDVTRELQRWFGQLSDAQQLTYRPFLLPTLLGYRKGTPDAS